MAKDSEDIRKHGAVTEYRPDDDRISGGRDHSVQTEALGADGDLPANSATSGGAAGRINTVDHPATPERDGGERDENRGLTR
jgi:hypothetical protein